MTHCPLCEAVTGNFAPSTARYVNTFIDYQGQLLCKPCSNAPVLRLQSNRAILAQPDHADLLTRLIVLYWRDGVTQEAAAKLVGIRRDEFVELAELRLGIYAFEAVAMGRLMAAFNELFPECDRRASYRKDCGFRSDDGIRQYTDADLLRVPNRD